MHARQDRLSIVAARFAGWIYRQVTAPCGRKAPSEYLSISCCYYCCYYYDYYCYVFTTTTTTTTRKHDH